MTQSDAIGNDPIQLPISNYYTLKTDICTKWHQNCISPDHLLPIVEFYRDTINSVRDAASIESLANLLDILERRDELSEFYVKALQSIVNQTMRMVRGEQWLYDLRDRVKEYEKSIHVPKACSCGEQHVYNKGEPVQLNRVRLYEGSFRPLNLQEPVEQTVVTEKMYDIKQDLQVVFDQIDNDWIKFLRGLDGIREAEINQMRNRYGNNKQCFYHCLVHWQMNADQRLRVRKSIVEALKSCGREAIALEFKS